MASTAIVKLRLPPCPPEICSLLRYSEYFDNIKLSLLQKLDLTSDLKEFDETTMLEFTMPARLTVRDARRILKQVVSAARIVCLDMVGLYFSEENDNGPFSPINELESLNFVLKGLISSHKEFNNKEFDDEELSGFSVRFNAFHILIALLLDEIEDLANKYESTYSDCRLPARGDSSLDDLMAKADSLGITTKLMIADGGRGLVAREDIEIGETVLEIPKSLVRPVGGLDPEMVKKYRCRSSVGREDLLALMIVKEEYSFDLFPKDIKTGLSFGKEALAAAEGTRLTMNTSFAKGSVPRTFRLFSREEDDLSPEKYDSYLHAHQLLLSCGIKILAQDGEWISSLVPFAAFFKRSLFPHVLRCDQGEMSLRFIAARPCGKGQQCYLSYGYLGGDEFAMNYGYLPKGVNHNDCIILDRESIDGGDSDIIDNYPPWPFWMVRGNVKIEGKNCFPKPLLDHLKSRVSLIYRNKIDPTETEIEATNILYSQLEWCVEQSEFHDREMRKNYPGALERPTWDVKLALDYKKMLRDACISALSACSSRN